MKEFIQVPKGLDYNDLIAEFGYQAVSFYEERIKQRTADGKIYLNPLKTIYIWAYSDRKTHQGYYTSFRGIGRGRHKNHGRS